MIADILHEACAQIDYALATEPDTYADYLAEVQAVLVAMRTLHGKLDNPLGHFDWHSPLPCHYCGVPAADHDVLPDRLLCPQAAGGNGTTFTLIGPERRTPAEIDHWLDSLPEAALPEEQINAIVAKLRKVQEEGTL